MQRTKACITAVGGYVPDYVLTNHELERYVETNDEWIVSRTGIRERRLLKDPEKATSYMCIEAAKQVLEQSDTRPEEVDMVICATTTPDYVFPATANIVADAMGMKNAFGYDVSAACSGFLYSLATGAAMVESGRYKKVLVLGADKMSSILNFKDRATCIIFGDGGGAVMLEPSQEGYGIEDMVLKSDGSGFPYLHQKAGGSRRPASHETVDQDMHYVYQEGATVFKFAVTNMAQAAADIMERNQLQPEDVAWLVPHQANRRIIEATANRMGIGMDKVMLNIDRYGNTTNGTIPLCLWEYAPQLKKGDKLVLAAFGGGFTWGSIYLTWGI